MLTRRLWIFPVWLWIILIVAAALIVMKLRKDKTGGSSILGPANLTDQQVLLMSWPADEWTTVSKPAGGKDAGTGGATNTPAPSPRVSTGTYTGGYVPTFATAPKISVRKSTSHQMVWPG